MGTSASAKGPKSSSPLVPPWADADPNAPLPQPEGQRFRGFRTDFGRVAAGVAGASLRSAVGKYAREASGGSSVGPRRFGPAYTAGAGLAGLIGELQSGGTGEASSGVDLWGLIGQPQRGTGNRFAPPAIGDRAD
jgi:hypothetical protein